MSAVCIVLSGYVMIHTNFRSQLEREVKMSQEYGEVVYYALSSEFNNFQYVVSSEIAQQNAKEKMSEIADSVGVDIMNQKVHFLVMTEEGESLFTSLPVVLDKEMIHSLSDEKAGWTIQNKENSYFIQTIRPILYEETLFYIETVRDVSSIYENQREQYETLVLIMIAMIFVVGIVTFLITRLLLQQIVELTGITAQIADGDLSKRAEIKGQDEISTLAANFNRMTENLENKIEELKAEAARKELFVGAFSHELKTPLTSIIGYSDLLRRKKLDAEKRNLCAQYIFTEGKRLETLSMRLLELIVLQNHTLHKTTENIQRIIEEVVAVIMPQLSESDIKLSCEVEPAWISMEADLMKTVFLNLMDNARKASNEKGKIEIVGKNNSKGYLLQIQDFGRGMEQEELGKIKDAFYMVDKSRARKQGGAGLGLAICDEIVKIHGFELSFKSELGVGTTVIIRMGGVSYEK